MISDPWFYIAAIPAVFLMGLSKGGFAGVGMLGTPLVAMAVGPIEAAGILLPVLIAQDWLAVWMFRKSWDRRIIRVMSPGAAIGILLAYLLSSSVSEAAVQIVLGVICVIFAARQIVQRQRSPGHPSFSTSRLLGAMSGGVAGFTSMLAHAGSPPFQFYVFPQRLGRDLYVGTSVVFFALVNAMKVPAYFALGQMTMPHLKAAAFLFPLAALSSWLGARLVRRIDVENFYTTVSILLGVTGLILIGQGIDFLLG